MADIELVIKIDEKLYETSKTLPDYMCGVYQRAIANGKPLPKIHGNLKDEDILKIYADKYDEVSLRDIKFSKTIIESNKDPDSIWRILED